MYNDARGCDPRHGAEFFSHLCSRAELECLGDRGVIETFPLDMLLSLGLGMSFSLARGEGGTEEEPLFGDIYFLAGLGFHTLVAFGVAFLCYLLYPDWMLMYLADHKKVPRRIISYIFSGYFAMYSLGFLSVPQLRKLGKRLPRSAFLCVLGSIFAFIFITFDRLWHVGTYDEYNRGEARAMTKTGLFPLLASAMPAAVAGLLALLRMLGRRSRPSDN